MRDTVGVSLVSVLGYSFFGVATSMYIGLPPPSTTIAAAVSTSVTSDDHHYTDRLLPC